MSGEILCDDRIRRLERKIRTVRIELPNHGGSPNFEPLFYMPEPRMLVQAFPFDHRIPALSEVAGDTPPALKSAFLDRFGAGGWRVERCDSKPIKYWARRRAVLRYTVEARDPAGGGSETKRFYVKLRRDRKDEATFRTLEALAANANGEAGFSVATPVAYLPGLHALVEEEAEGTPLCDLLSQRDEPTPVMRTVSGALASFHRCGVEMTRRHAKRDEIARIDRVSRLLHWALPHLGARIDRLAAATARGLDDDAPAPTHLDLGPDHVLIDCERIVLIDLGTCAAADPLLDVAQLAAQISALRHTGDASARVARKAARTLVDTYLAQAPDTWRHRFPLLFGSAALTVAASLFRKQGPCWSKAATAMIDEGLASLSGRRWETPQG